MTEQEILEWYYSDDCSPIYAYMYGKPWINVCNRLERDRVIDIEKKELKLGADKNCFIFVWGYPGPDYNVYNFEDYGITWAFKEEEIVPVPQNC